MVKKLQLWRRAFEGRLVICSLATLLVLYRKFALCPDAPFLLPLPYRPCLRYNLRLLVHHREICDGRHVVLTLTMTPFIFAFSAVLPTWIRLIREDASPVARTVTLTADEGGMPLRKATSDKLKPCKEHGPVARTDQSASDGIPLLAAAIALIPEEC